MNDSEFEKLKSDEAAAYARYSAADDALKSAGEAWLPFRHALDRELMKREIAKEMAGQGRYASACQ